MTASKLAAAAASYPASRALPYAAVLLVAAMSAYYVYRDPAALKWLEAHQPAASEPAATKPAATESVQTPVVIRSPATAGLQSTPAPPDIGAASSTSNASAESTVEMPSTASPAADQPARSDDSSLPLSADRTPSRKDIPVTARAVGPEVANQIIHPAAPHAGAAPARLGRAAPSSSAVTTSQRAIDHQIATPPESPRVSVCTKAVAALGFCNPSAIGNN